MDYFNLAFIIIIAVQSIVFRKVLSKKATAEEVDKLLKDLDSKLKSILNDVENKISEDLAIKYIEQHTRMKELNVFSHELAKLQREEVLNLHTKINNLQKRITKFGHNLVETKEDLKLVAKNPSKARKKFSQDD